MFEFFHKAQPRMPVKIFVYMRKESLMFYGKTGGYLEGVYVCVIDENGMVFSDYNKQSAPKTC